MKRNKEIYATAIAALCMQQDAPTPYGWWFTKPQQDPPDGIIGTLIENTDVGGNIMHGREVEIVEYLDGSLIETIQSKLKDKSYEPNTILVCLLSPKTSIQILNFKAVAKQLNQSKLPLAHIFLIGHGMQITSAFSNLTKEEQIAEMQKVFFIQLLPKYGVVSVSPYTLCEAFRAGKEQAWLKFEGLGRSTGLQEVTVAEAPKLFD